MVDSEDCIDRISNLPDPLLSQILSLHPTKCAVATSFLSTKWKFLWTSITNLDIDSNGAKRYSENEVEVARIKFTHFVNMVLLLLDPPSIQNFRLECRQEYIDPLYLNSWIRVAFGRTIGKLDLKLVAFKRIEKPVELPHSRIYCNLVVLKLEGHIFFNIPATSSVCFPSLQTLHLLDEVMVAIDTDSYVSFPSLKILWLSCVDYLDEDSVRNFFSRCPVLDELFIERSGSDYVPCLIIRIPSLTRLTLEFKHLYRYGYKLQIDTPALQCVNIDDLSPCEYLPVENLSSLLEAKVNFYFNEAIIHEEEFNVESCINIIKFLGSLSNVKFLSVSGQTLMAFRRASPNISLCFHYLSRLELVGCDCHELSAFVNFLEGMDNLEHLVLQEHCQYFGSHKSWWTEPLNVPKCLMWRLTTISFGYLTNECCDKHELLRYFLRNAKVLQLVTIKFFFFSERKIAPKDITVPKGIADMSS